MQSFFSSKSTNFAFKIDLQRHLNFDRLLHWFFIGLASILDPNLDLSVRLFRPKWGAAIEPHPLLWWVSLIFRSLWPSWLPLGPIWPHLASIWNGFGIHFGRFLLTFWVPFLNDFGTFWLLILKPPLVATGLMGIREAWRIHDFPMPSVSLEPLLNFLSVRFQATILSAPGVLRMRLLSVAETDIEDGWEL